MQHEHASNRVCHAHLPHFQFAYLAESLFSLTIYNGQSFYSQRGIENYELSPFTSKKLFRCYGFF